MYQKYLQSIYQSILPLLYTNNTLNQNSKYFLDIYIYIKIYSS